MTPEAVAGNFLREVASSLSFFGEPCVVIFVFAEADSALLPSSSAAFLGGFGAAADFFDMVFFLIGFSSALVCSLPASSFSEAKLRTSETIRMKVSSLLFPCGTLDIMKFQDI